METKFCRDCGAHRPVAEFSRNKRSRDGLAFYCRDHLAERSARSREARRVQPRKNRLTPKGLAVPDGCKWCPDCAEVKSFDAFPRSRASSSGYATYCLPCHNARGRASKEKIGGSRTYHLSRRYGISAQEADVMLEKQGGLCAICRAAPAQHVDHDHATGAVRALLCFNCNGGLGQFRDDPDLLHLAAFYLEHHTQRQAIAYLAAAGGADPEADSRPGEPPVGSQRRPDAPSTTVRSTGRTSSARRRKKAGGSSGSA